MNTRIIILSLLIFLLSAVSFSQVTRDEKLAEEVKKYGEAEVVISYPGRNAIELITRNVSITAVKDKKVYISLTAAALNWFLSQRFDYEIIEKEPAKGIISASSVSGAMEWDSYPTYTQYDSIMRKFQADYPQLCQLDTIGTSILGRLVLVLKISDNVNDDEPEPEVFYSSTIHGDELGGFVLMLRLADYLLKNYNTDSRVRNLVDNLEIWINPLANPDGTYRTGNEIISPTRSNANGIDLNRNFPDPMNPSIVPEKENIDMMAFMRKRRFVLSANFHSGFEVVNFPWDRWLSKYHADHDWFYYISRKYADTVHVYSGPAYMNYYDNGVVRGAEWYIIYGGRQDFITWELQGREVTIELDDIKQTPAAQLELLWQYNRQSLIGYLENALYGIHGRVVDAVTKKPVPAKIYIAGHDKDSSHVYADSLTGYFTRFLAQGSWNLTFSATGYKDTVVQGVNVVNNQRTDLYVEMKSTPTDIDSVNPEKPLLFPNPSSEIIECRLPDSITGQVKVSVINSNGVKILEYLTSDRPVILNVASLDAGVYTVVFKSTVTGHSASSRFVVYSRHY
ncbi:MAG TPA: M14 family zinc carboxypeptidase [Bacteroidales bacterium]|nr:M14 family zinc carboxypeptidase [Bacteroidales bacterium]HOU31588.1 M14 family zinc carboxypeptidase [Bacteroidales bacterium]HQG56121.1 M14 family zinc carboxypeptidase [Bacteroidales bacterium]HQK69732.1 M14 family zinc carboxypeptidase [Bacteroidales bacterium]HRR15419.1 M14 family zinc carboxypeptidase [Bacteroidales bacterium]